MVATERSRLKMILIFILALTDLFLAAHWIGLRARERNALRRVEDRLTALYRADGILLSRSVIAQISKNANQTPLSGIKLSRDTEQEISAAVFFLGQDTELIQSGDTRGYIASDGESVARFYPGGGFTVTGLNIEKNAEAICREFCEAHGYEPPDKFDLDDGVLPATAIYQDLPVYNCQLYFSFKDGVLSEVLGTLLPRMEIHSDSDPAADLSAAGALALFQARGQDSRGGVKNITGVEARWIYESDGTETADLIPAWRIVTDAGDYYINRETGRISSG